MTLLTFHSSRNEKGQKMRGCKTETNLCTIVTVTYRKKMCWMISSDQTFRLFLINNRSKYRCSLPNNTRPLFHSTAPKQVLRIKIQVASTLWICLVVVVYHRVEVTDTHKFFIIYKISSRVVSLYLRLMTSMLKVPIIQHWRRLAQERS